LDDNDGLCGELSESGNSPRLGPSFFIFAKGKTRGSGLHT
jgi:hypothetical protein